MTQLMTTVWNPTSSRKRFLVNTNRSLLFYSSNVWSEALSKKVYRKRIAQIQRRGDLWETSTLRTASEPTMMAAGVTLHTKEDSREVVARGDRQHIGFFPENEPRGRHTVQLIGNLIL